MKQSVITCVVGIIVGFLGGLIFRSELFQNKRQPSRGQILDGRGTAAEWKTFSTQERSVYVEGYVGGYRIGSLDACDNTDSLFITKGQAVLSDGTLNYPVSICDAALDQFTRMGLRGNQRGNYSMYSDVISSFYQMYPKYSNVPFPFLMRAMTDKRKMITANALYEGLERHDLEGTF